MASFNTEESPVPKIESPDHLQAITAKTRVRLRSLFNISYPPGLFQIVEAFINEIRSLPVLIQDISYDQGHLYLRFEMYRQYKEATVWRAVHDLQIKAGLICSECGGIARRQVYQGELMVVCRECLAKESPANGRTGTWLDTYA